MNLTSEEILTLFLSEGENTSISNDELKIEPHLLMPQLLLRNGTPIIIRTIGNPNKIPPQIEKIRVRQDFFLQEMVEDILRDRIFFPVGETSGFTEYLSYGKEGYDVSTTLCLLFWRRWRSSPLVEQTRFLISPNRDGFWATVESVAFQNGICYFTSKIEGQSKSKVFEVNSDTQLIWATPTPEIQVPIVKNTDGYFDETQHRQKPSIAVPIPEKRELTPRSEISNVVVESLKLEIKSLEQRLNMLHEYTASLYSFMQSMEKRIDAQELRVSVPLKEEAIKLNIENDSTIFHGFIK